MDYMDYIGVSVFSGKAVKIQAADKKISSITEIPQEPGLPYISPGFLDIQVNGIKDSDYKLMSFSIKDIESICASLAASGTTQHFPTIITGPHNLILRNLEIIRHSREKDPDIKAAIPGIHIEGPYISDDEGARGAHDPAYICDPDFGEFREWQEAAGGDIKIITLAPERKGAIDFIGRVADTGVTIAIGHTAADPETIRKAVNAGAKISTHLGNGSHSMIPRLQNYIWEQMAADELYASIITDGFHLPISVVKVITRSKSLSRLILVSDVALFAGKEPGIYADGNLEKQIFEDGHMGLPGTAILAGAAHLLDWDIPRFMRFTGSSLKETVPLCTTNPASILGLPKKFGKLEPGAPANLVLFDFNEERLNIKKTIRAGKEIY